MPHTCANILLHIIFSTRRRQPLIQPEIKSDLFAYMGGIVRTLRGVALIINGPADHVHMLVRVPPAHSVADVARIVKPIPRAGHMKSGRRKTLDGKPAMVRSA